MYAGLAETAEVKNKDSSGAGLRNSPAKGDRKVSSERQRSGWGAGQPEFPHAQLRKTQKKGRRALKGGGKRTWVNIRYVP